MADDLPNPTDLWVYPRWQNLTADMLFWPSWPVSPTQPHYVTLAQLAEYINPGTANLPPAGPGEVLGNPTGTTMPAIATSLSSIIDRAICADRGAILFRGPSVWQCLAPGADGRVLTTHGPGADPNWTDGGGLVTGAPVTISATPPSLPRSGDLWWDTVGGQLYVYYDDGTSAQWVAATNETGSRGDIIGGDGIPPPPDAVNYDQLVFIDGVWTAQAPRYIMGCFVPGTMVADQYLLVHRVSKGVTFPANFGAYLGHASQSRGTELATGATVIDVQRATAGAPGTFTSVGSISFASGSMVGTFASLGGANVIFSQGDSLALRGPSAPDGTFANFAATLVGYEN